MTTFSEGVLDVAERIPRGRVAAFWTLAEHAGSPRAYGPAGRIIRLARDGGDPRIPWWRVVDCHGTPQFRGKGARLVLGEGVELNERGRVPQEFFWSPGMG